MVAFTHCRRSPHWVWIGWWLGLAVCLGCGSRVPPGITGSAQVENGRQLLAKGQVQEAVAAFEQATQANPRHALAFFHLAEAQRQLGHTDAAITGYAEAIRAQREMTANSLTPSDRQAALSRDEVVQAHFYRATLLSEAGQPDQAIEDFAQALQLDPQHADAYCGRGMAFLKQRLLEPALDDLTEAHRLEPKSPEILCQRARAWLAVGNYAKAIEDARSAIRLNAQSAEAFHVLGSALLLSPSQQPERAVDYFLAAIRLNQALATEVNAELARAYFDWGVSLHKAGKRLKAKAVFGKAETLEPKYVAQAYFHWAVSLDKNGEWLEAEVAFVAAERLDAVYAAQAYFDWAVSLDNAGQRTQADKAFDHAQELDAKYAELYGKYVENRESLNTVTLLPIVQSLRVEVDELLGQGKVDKALEKYTEILNKAPRWPVPLWERGELFLQRGFADTALSDFDRALRLDPKSAQAYCLRGRAFTELHNYFRAIQDLTEAIRLQPDLAWAYFYRAVAYVKDDRPDRALADLGQAVRLDAAAVQLERKLTKRAPAVYAEIYETFGSRDLRAKRWDEAISSFEKALRFDQNRSRQIHPLLAQAYRERGFRHSTRSEFPEAVRDLKQAAELDQYHAQTFRLCGLTCSRMAKACRDRGLTASEKEQWEAAVFNLRRAIALDWELEFPLRRPLEDAERQLAALAP